MFIVKQSREILKSLAELFVAETGLIPVTAAEIEFYADLPEGYDFAPLNEKIKKAKIKCSEIKKESGKNQFEIALYPDLSPIKTVQSLEELKKILKKEIKANFAPKPYKALPGSGLHINLSIVDKQGNNLFSKPVNTEETELMLFAVGGLLKTLKEALIFFAPKKASYKRFSGLSYNKETETYNNSPSKICWSGNNRTVAVRVPASSHEPNTRHIEHRVAGVDAEPNIVMACVLAGIMHGLKNKTQPGEKIWGNAYDSQYKHEEIPQTLELAQEGFEKSLVIKPLFYSLISKN